MLRKLDGRDKTKPRGFLTSRGPADGLRPTHAAHRFAHGRKRSIIRQTEFIFLFWANFECPPDMRISDVYITNLERQKILI